MTLGTHYLTFLFLAFQSCHSPQTLHSYLQNHSTLHRNQYSQHQNLIISHSINRKRYTIQYDNFSSQIFEDFVTDVTRPAIQSVFKEQCWKRQGVLVVHHPLEAQAERTDRWRGKPHCGNLILEVVLFAVVIKKEQHTNICQT